MAKWGEIPKGLGVAEDIDKAGDGLKGEALIKALDSEISASMLRLEGLRRRRDAAVAEWRRAVPEETDGA